MNLVYNPAVVRREIKSRVKMRDFLAAQRKLVGACRDNVVFESRGRAQTHITQVIAVRVEHAPSLLWFRELVRSYSMLGFLTDTRVEYLK